MSIYSFYDAATGRIAPMRYEGPARWLAANTPPGHIAIAGELDPERQQVDVETGAVVDREPDSGDIDAAWRRVRARRDRLLAGTDWIVTRATERAESLPAGWSEYRQALRDITLQADPFSITWPEPPT